MSAVPTSRMAPLSMAEVRQMTGSTYVSRREAAAIMCVSEKYLATHLHDGPKRLRLGSKVVYRLADIESYMRQMEVL